MNALAESILAVSTQIRQAATYLDLEHRSVQRDGLHRPGDSPTERYEELIVNPTLLTLVAQRGNIDCGGVRSVLVRYGNSYRLLLPLARGHLSIAIDPSADPKQILRLVVNRLAAEPGLDLHCAR